jgi:hypothetical protein
MWIGWSETTNYIQFYFLQLSNCLGATNDKLQNPFNDYNSGKSFISESVIGIHYVGLENNN